MKILGNIVEAMDKDSKILINEQVVPNVGAHAQATAMDMLMMGTFGSIERTEKQWYDLLENKCGLKIKSLKTYVMFMGDSVIECIPAKFA